MTLLLETPPVLPGQDADAPGSIGPVPSRRRHGLLRGIAWMGGLACAAIGAMAFSGISPMGMGRPAVRTVAASRASLTMLVRATGSFESAKSQVVINEVEGQTTILTLTPEGTRVAKGDVVCELDSSAMRDRLTTQQMSTRQAEGNLQSAEKNLIVAEMSLKEYMDGTYPTDLWNAKSQELVAESTLAQVISKDDWSRSMVVRGMAPPSMNQTDRIARLSSEISLTSARKRIEVLENYTRRRRMTELQAAVDRARVDVRAAQASYDLERRKEEKLVGLISKCKLTAPADGMVVYSNNSGGRRGQQAPEIQEGATVRERQPLFSIPDIRQMRVVARIHESEVPRVNVKQKAKVAVESLGVTLDGEVTMVQTMPEQNADAMATDRYYIAWVQVSGAPSALRPGMSAKVEIEVGQAKDVLALPAESIVAIRDASYVYAINGTQMTMKPVQLGAFDERMVEVQSGLNEGETVALRPMDLLSEDARRQAFGDGTATARSEEWK